MLWDRWRRGFGESVEFRAVVCRLRWKEVGGLVMEVEVQQSSSSILNLRRVESSWIESCLAIRVACGKVCSSS